MPQFCINLPDKDSHPYWQLDEFARGYVESMFFTNCDTGDEREDLANELGVGRLTRESVANIRADCSAFLGHTMPDGCCVRQWLDRAPEYDDGQAGIDFWLTRQGHGVSFEDRPELGADLFEPTPEYLAANPGLGGWQTRRDDTEQGPCKGTIAEGLAEAAREIGEVYPEIWRGWIYYRSAAA